MSNTTNRTLSEASNTKSGTAEQGALKTIHRSYNKLNGWEAMLHIIDRYKFVLYPFIMLSILGSAYSFYMDDSKAFPMMPEWLKITKALFFSVMLEIVRDGSIIAIFNSKMKIPSRAVVVIIFFGVTFYLFNTHIKTKDIIQESAIEYALLHQDEKTVSVKNPRFEMTSNNLKTAIIDLKTAKLEYAKQLDISANAKFRVNKINAQKQLPILKAEKTDLEAKIKQYQDEIVSMKQDNITSIKDSQELIGSVLLNTLILVELLAMLGAVIKFINKDNAQKEVAKHSEIIEEYENISEQMRKSNDDLGFMLSQDVESQGQQSTAFIKAIAENRKVQQKQMTEVMNMIASIPSITFNQPKMEAIEMHSKDNSLSTPTVGFKPTSTVKKRTVDELITGKNLQKIFIGSNNKGAIYAYLYREHLISNNREAVITKPMNGYIMQDSNLYNNVPFITPSEYYKAHAKLYHGKQNSLDHLIRTVDDIIAYSEAGNDEYSSKDNKQIGFNTLSKSELTSSIMNSVSEIGDKLPTKTQLIDIKSRTEKKIYESTMKELDALGVVHYENGNGYYLSMDKQTAMSEIRGAM